MGGDYETIMGIMNKKNLKLNGKNYQNWVKKREGVRENNNA